MMGATAQRPQFDAGVIPSALAERPQWLVWRFEPGEKKPKKMPYYVSGDRRTGVQGSDADRAALVPLAIAVKRSAAGYSGVGFAFLPGDGLIGIDIDGCIDLETGEIAPRAGAIIDACASYTEYSPSAKGVHIIVAGESETFKSNDIGLEVFCGRQFFTFTGNVYPGTPSVISTIAPVVLNKLRVTVKQAKGTREAKSEHMPAPVTDERSKLESALTCIPPDCGYDDWIRVGMSIFAALGAGGISVWDWWSSKSKKYGGIKDLEGHWKSFDGAGGITAATVYKMAVDAGWRPPKSAKQPIIPRDRAAPAQALHGGEGISTLGAAGAMPLVLPGDDAMDDVWRDSLIRKPSNNRLEDCRENVLIIMLHDPELRGVVALNEFSMMQVKQRTPPWGGELGEWSEADDFHLGMYLAQQHGLVIKSDGAIEKAVAQAARESKYNPVTAYLRGLKWDGKQRLHTWLTSAMGVEPSKYSALIGTLFIMSLVARAFRPGCQMDYAPVFEGGQGAGKSSAMRVLGGEWYSETPFKIGDKDSYLAIQGVWLYEIAELDSFNRSETTAVKAFITNMIDRFRAPYGRRMLNVERRTCFCATTNQDEYFKDTTGNRRFWPIRCGHIDLALLALLRDQLFAEAVDMVDAGSKWYPTREEQRELIEPQQEMRELEDVWTPRLYRFVEGISESEDRVPLQRLDEVTAETLLTRALHIEIGKISAAKGDTMRIASCMGRMGWKKRRRTGGAREWYYARPADVVEDGDALPI